MSKKKEEDEEYCLTEWSCLSSILTEYGIDISHISGRVGKHIVEDFMESLEDQGYLKKAYKYSNISSVDDLIAATPEPTMRPVSEGFFNKAKEMEEEISSFCIDQAKLRPPKNIDMPEERISYFRNDQAKLRPPKMY